MSENQRRQIGAKLKELRQRAGYSRRELAESLGTYYGRVCNWENGRVAPSERYLGELAEHYGVTVAYLAGSDEAA